MTTGFEACPKCGSLAVGLPHARYATNKSSWDETDRAMIAKAPWRNNDLRCMSCEYEGLRAVFAAAGLMSELV